MEPMIALVATLATSSTVGPAFAVDLRVDGAVLGAAAAVSFAWALSDELAPPACLATRCDPQDVPAFDRFTAGQYAPGWRTASDVGIASYYLLAAGALLVDEGPAHGARDLVVVAESILVANAIGVLVELSARRPRPLVSSARAPLEERARGNSALSFPSGHTAGAFAATLALFSALERLHPDEAWPWVALGVGLAAASFVAISRVAAGDHFPSDVVAGAVLGTSAGLLVPALHDGPLHLAGGAGATVGVAMSW